MPQKYIDMLTNMPAWLPFLGMATGQKPPFGTRIAEAGIMALVPILVTYLMLVPELKAQIKEMRSVYEIQAAQYTAAQIEVSTRVADNSRTLNALQIDNAVSKSILAEIKVTVDKTNDIANTKVRSIEGRLDSIERVMKK